MGFALCLRGLSILRWGPYVPLSTSCLPGEALNEAVNSGG